MECSLSLSRIFCIFQFPRPAVTRSPHSITISHQKTDTAQLLPTIALLFDKRKLFTNSPGNWKTATDSSQTSDRGGKGTHVKTKKLVQELASSQNSYHHTLANLETGQTLIFVAKIRDAFKKNVTKNTIYFFKNLDQYWGTFAKKNLFAPQKGQNTFFNF